MKAAVAWLVILLLILAGYSYKTDPVLSATCVGPGPSATVVGTRVLRRMGQMVNAKPHSDVDIKADIDKILWKLYLLWRSLKSGTDDTAIPPEIIQLQKADDERRRTAPLCSVALADCPQPDPNPAQPFDPKSASLITAATTPEQTARDAARRYFPADQVDVAVAVAGAESSWNPRASLTYRGQHMRGLWQINDGAHAGLIRGRDWTDPTVNAWMAFTVWKDAGGSWHPWSTYNSGSYRRYLRAGATSPLTPRETPPPPAVCTAAATSPGDSAPSTGQVRTLIEPTSGITYRIPIPAGPRGVAINFALDQVVQGDWYRWAAHGPDLWDCSGLVAGAWGKAGIRLTPQSEAMRRQIPRTSNPQPGDITWHPGHVQLILGRINGQDLIVEAPHTGSRMRVRPQWMHPQAVLDPTKIGEPA